MKIIHIITGLHSGGAEAVLYRLIQHRESSQHIVISMMDEGKYGSKLTTLDIPVFCLNMPRGKITFYGLKKLWRILKKQKPDVVQTWMYHADLVGGTIARLIGIKRIVWGIRNSNLSPEKTSLSTRLVARTCALLSHLVPAKIVSCAAQAVESHQSIGYANKRFVIIPNGYNFQQFTPNLIMRKKIHEQLGLSDMPPNLGMIGRFDSLKDHLNLIKALGILNKNGILFRCLLVGLDMDANNTILNQWLNQENIQDNVLLLGQSDDIPSVMNALDLHVLSSIGEAFPNVLAEAMACGIPCVTTNVGDAALIVGDTGWVVPPSDSQALADAILAAIEEKERHPDTWRARKQAARQHIINNFSIERMVVAYNKVWLGAKK